MPSRKQTPKNGVRSPRVMLAAELARLREESGWSLRELSDKVGWDHAHLFNMEKGKSLGSPELVEALDAVYETTPFLQRLWELAKDASVFRDKYQVIVQLEADATVIEMYITCVIPGLFQTEAYAREFMWSAPHGPENVAELEELLAGRLERQGLLRRCPAPHIRVVLGEPALRLALPDAAQWREQLAHLVEMAAAPHVTMQVLPYSAGLHELLHVGSLTLLRMPGGRTVVWQESSMSGELIEDVDDVERYRLSYDVVRDRALSPRESVAFIEQLMEDLPCDPSETT